MKFINLKVLYWGAAQESGNERIDMHHHDFYQLEICRTGQRLCRSRNSEDILLNPGESVFIPIGVKHSFMPYKNRSCTYFSFKFRLLEDAELPHKLCLIPTDFFTQWVLKSLEELLSPEDELPKHASVQPAEIISVLLTGLLNHFAEQPHDVFADYNLLRHIRQAIYQFGAELSVKLIAEGLDLTVPQLRYRFRKEMDSLPPETVRFNNPADFIASELMEIAKTHLRTTALSVNEISNILKFNNVYTFSRFFKHNCGLSPLQYRNICISHNSDN